MSAKRSKAAAELARGHDALFDEVVVPSSPSQDSLLSVALVAPDEALVGALLASETSVLQVDMLARRPDMARIKQALHALLGSGGTLPVTALAQRVNLPPSRRPEGFAAVLRQLLNYDGVQVLETLADGRTLRLDTGLLRQQFEL
ncbi:hypothetical protein ACWDR0_12960 [Streptomyces sp. NPDC003691]